MIKYIKRNISKFKEEVLGKAIYDLAKYAFVTLFALLVLKLLPEGTSISYVLGLEVVLTVQGLLVIILSTVALTIIIYFILNRKKFRIIKLDLRTDELTLLLNHRALKEDLPKCIEGARRDDKALALILLDIDNFKDFNTRFNQKIADNVLKKFGAFLKSDSRITDTVYRQHLKGDEFLIIARDTNLNNALKAANRKRETIALTGIKLEEVDQLIYLTVCCGVVELSGTDTSDSIMERAFSAMKQAKLNPTKNMSVSLI